MRECGIIVEVYCFLFYSGFFIVIVVSMILFLSGFCFEFGVFFDGIRYRFGMVGEFFWR